MLESLIEQHLVKEVNRRDGLCLKFNSQSMTGIPDRIILMKNGTVGFVEVKQKGKKPRPLQKLRMKQLRRLGFKVYTLDEKEKIGEILDEICST
ncbi:VRR-NUC domain-containing protein [Gemella sp.]|jgi:VRR-NUC domain protein